MKKKKKPVQVDLKALRKLLQSVAQKTKPHATAVMTLAAILIIGIFASVPKVQNYFGSQSSKASGLGSINPIVPPSGTGTPIDPGVAPWAPEGQEIKLILPISISPRIHNNRVVFQQVQPFPSFDSDIFVYDLVAKLYILVSTDLEGERQPDIFNNRVVFIAEHTYGTSDIFLYDLSTQAKVNISNNPANEFPTKVIQSSSPTMYGNMVAWKNSISGSSVPESYQQIVLYNITTGEKEVVSQFETDTNYGAGKEVDMYGNIIVWSDKRTGVLRIYAHNIQTGEESILSPGGNLDRITPAIYRHQVVWQEGTYYNNVGIRMYDLITHQEYQITNTNGYFPEIDRNIIVWQGYTGNYDYNIYIHRISDPVGANYSITTNTAYQGNPDVFANKIVWEDSRDEGWPTLGIYMFELMN